MKSPYKFCFRRDNLGENACGMLLKQWLEDSKKRVQGSFTLAVPQVHYQLNIASQAPLQQCYRGELQLLIPLFCGTNIAKLALSLDFDGNQYKANTVLRIQWAYSNARLLAAPQATWILQPEE